MPVLGRQNAPKLLKTVGGRQHASDNDHEETSGRHNGKTVSKLNQEEDDIYGEPMSSGDEKPKSPSPPLQPPKTTNPSQKRKAAAASPESRTPQQKPVKKATVPRIPRVGSYQMGKDDIARRGLEDKNKTVTAPSLSEDEPSWDLAYGSQPSSQPQKKQYSTSNIHKRPAKGKPKTFGKKQHTYNSLEEASNNDHLKPLDETELDEALGISRDKPTPDTQLRKPTATKRRPVKTNTSKVTGFDDNELDDILGLDEDNPFTDTPLRKPAGKKERTNNANDAYEMKPFNTDELDDELGSSKPALLHQLGEWIQDRTPNSSQPQSSAPQEDLDNIEGYMRELPASAPEGTICTICKSPVSTLDYWAFWSDKPKTVKNQTTFCTSHRKRSAQEDYDREGYPVIDWFEVPKRIKKHRMALHKVLGNDTPSVYRDRYAPLALTGKAAAIPSRRSASDTDSPYTLDDHSTYPGYYGARGRRAITEAVMALLRNEIKRSHDPVVQTSGPAAFVQAVLVPEVAVLLIMEDCTVDRDEAEEIRERTYDMGLLLNEEIEDLIEVEAGESDGGEYGAQ